MIVIFKELNSLIAEFTRPWLLGALLIVISVLVLFS